MSRAECRECAEWFKDKIKRLKRKNKRLTLERKDLIAELGQLVEEIDGNNDWQYDTGSASELLDELNGKGGAK